MDQSRRGDLPRYEKTITLYENCLLSVSLMFFCLDPRRKKGKSRHNCKGVFIPLVLKLATLKSFFLKAQHYKHFIGKLPVLATLLLTALFSFTSFSSNVSHWEGACKKPQKTSEKISLCLCFCFYSSLFFSFLALFWGNLKELLGEQRAWVKEWVVQQHLYQSCGCTDSSCKACRWSSKCLSNIH